ncbi:alpha/beta fold hydrolase [Bacillus taeanensis]|uniref:Alpha/beta hydrolase n=1 Tax=Bacillus taeanensis TaxID=273032 RepID=A0A366Y005_9BACI|nr:alpha/beta hydrolase [Bacillus taeanensis]RBW70705.1 alpha/beta hydrolase [Bacillus taeanensis]
MGKVELKAVELPNGEKIGYREREGGEEVVLLIHGNMTSSKHWDLVLEHMNEKYKLYAVDLRGFGTSSYNEPINSIKDFSEDIKQFVDGLGLEQFSILGWSTGGAVGMQFAANYPQYMNKLLLLAPASTRGYPMANLSTIPPTRYETKQEIEGDLTRTIPITAAYKMKNTEFLRSIWDALIYTDNKPEEKRYEEYLEDMITQRNLADVYHALNTFNISKHHNGVTEGTGEAANIEAPVYVLWGENDKVISKEMIDEVIEDLGDKAALIILKGCGHSPPIDDLGQLLTAVESVLKE